jgi:hypothetical protein
MSHDLHTSQQNILTHVVASINWDVFSGGIEEAETLANTGGVLRPHIVLRFGSAQPYLGDSSFGGARYDGVYSTVDALCVAAKDDQARALATEATNTLLGFRPDANCGELNYGWGGGTFTVVSEGSRPQFYIAWASFRFNFNMSDVGV